MRLWIAAGVAALILALPMSAQAQKPEVTKVQLGVGGKTSLYYLPLTVTEKLGYFKEAGLDVEISDFAGGARSLQALMGGSVDVVTGSFDHTIQIQAKGEQIIALVQMGRFPGFALALRKEKADAYKSPKDLKGMKIGVTAPGSSTHFMVLYMMAQAGLKPEDASFIGTGSGNTVLAAVKRGEVDAISNADPMINILDREGAIKIVADTRTARRHASGLWRAVSGGDALHDGGVRREEPEHRAGAGDRAGARAEMGAEPLAGRDRQGDAGGIRARQQGDLYPVDHQQPAGLLARREIHPRRAPRPR